MSPPPPADPQWLRDLLARPDRDEAVAALWADLPGTPVLGRTEERDGRAWQEVTFLWRRSAADVEVMVHVNAITDDLREDVTPALLEHLPGTDLWHLSWWLPSDGTWGYRFVEQPQIPRDAGRTHEGWLGIHQAGVLDPHNPAWQPHALGERSSVLVLPDAYQHPAWGSVPGASDAAALPFAGPNGEPRHVHRWAPTVDPVATLVLLDGEQWRALGIGDALHRTWPPVELLLIDVIDFATRSRDLPDPVRAAALVQGALAAAHPDGHSPAHTIVAGQSYGGLAAAAVALHRPDLAAHAIVQSGSFWFADGVAPTRVNVEPGDLTTALAAGALGSPPVRLRVHVGTGEGAMVPQARAFVAAAHERGLDVTLTEVTGGHDYAWWKHHLLRELELTLPDAIQLGG